MKFFDQMLDTDLDRDGRWCTFVPGMRFRIARMDNRRARDFYRERLQDAQERAGKAAVPAEEQQAIALETLARHVLAGWEGVDGEDGQPMAYSAEKALELLRLDRCRDWKAWVEAQASDATAYRSAARKDAEGNSGSA